MNAFDSTQRHPAEEFWVENYDWLAEQGYLLRPRYHPLWIPSWTHDGRDPADCEDNIPIPNYVRTLVSSVQWNSKHIQRLRYVMDATRMSDGKMVMLKKNEKEEASILHYFSALPQAASPQNHTVPIFALITLEHFENMQIVVMPFLRPFNSPPFDTVGEGVDFIRQALEVRYIGLAREDLSIFALGCSISTYEFCSTSASTNTRGQYIIMKKEFIYRNCTSVNFMMDATELYPQGFHPLMQDKTRNLESHRVVYTRTEKRPKYYLVNFSSARFYDSNERQPLDHPVYGTDRSVPEFQGEKFEQSHDPFATDVYYLGNMIKNEFVHVSVVVFILFVASYNSILRV